MDEIRLPTSTPPPTKVCSHQASPMNTYLLKLPLKMHSIFLDNPHLSGVKYLLAVTSESWQPAT